MIDDFLGRIVDSNALNAVDIDNLSPLTLAYIGDAVYEVFIRTFLVSTQSTTTHNLHLQSVKYVKAKAQAVVIHRINDMLTPEEQDIVRRGRNAKSGTISKGTDMIEYKYSTGFEALIGFLYLSKNFLRLMEILKVCIKEEEK